MRRLIMLLAPLTCVGLVAGTLLACADDSTASRSTPTPFFTGGAGPSGTHTPPATTPPLSGGDEGTVTIGATRYAFTVRTCTAVNGQYYLIGDGDVSVALASMLILQTGRGSFMVGAPAVSASGTTLTVSGTARNLILTRDRVEVSLTAPCPALAD